MSQPGMTAGREAERSPKPMTYIIDLALIGTHTPNGIRTHSKSVPLWVYELLTMVHNLG
jgi:hypothetical protein